MPIPSPFHPRTAALCTSLLWKDWSGYHAVRSYDTYLEREYYAFRHAAGMIDVSPLFKYDVRGPEAGEFLARVMVKDIRRLAVGRATYCCWCDDDGKVVDDGMVQRLDEGRYRVTSAEPSLAWLEDSLGGYAATVRDESDRVAVLAVQGPRARAILADLGDGVVEGLAYFRLAATRLGGIEAVVSRTGYTGDLGYEVWVASEDAVRLWDAVREAGRPHGLEPAGLDAMDVTRVEAGFLLNGVDYHSAPRCLIEARKSTPYELALGWAVDLDRDPFNGQAALRREWDRGPASGFVGLVLDWDAYEGLFAAHGLPPAVPAGASRDPVPVHAPGGERIGQATSRAWSPILKRYLALATVPADHAATGTSLEVEVTVEFERERVPATVVEKPFFDPTRKRA